jgi:hypothetical protein
MLAASSSPRGSWVFASGPGRRIARRNRVAPPRQESRGTTHLRAELADLDDEQPGVVTCVKLYGLVNSCSIALSPWGTADFGPESNAEPSAGWDEPAGGFRSLYGAHRHQDGPSGDRAAITRQPRPRWADDIDDDDQHRLMLPPAVEKLRTDRNFAPAALPAQPMPFGPQTAGPRERNKATAAIRGLRLMHVSTVSARSHSARSGR